MRIDEIADPVGNELPFNIVDDLHAFMTNDTMFYRKEYYPTMCDISDNTDKMKDNALAKVIMPMIYKAAKIYCKKVKLGKDDSDLIKL